MTTAIPSLHTRIRTVVVQAVADLARPAVRTDLQRPPALHSVPVEDLVLNLTRPQPEAECQSRAARRLAKA
jgi:hypothetical protein